MANWFNLTQSRSCSKIVKGQSLQEENVVKCSVPSSKLFLV